MTWPAPAIASTRPWPPSPTPRPTTTRSSPSTASTSSRTVASPASTTPGSGRRRCSTCGGSSRPVRARPAGSRRPVRPHQRGDDGGRGARPGRRPLALGAHGSGGHPGRVRRVLRAPLGVPTEGGRPALVRTPPASADLARPPSSRSRPTSTARPGRRGPPDLFADVSPCSMSTPRTAPTSTPSPRSRSPPRTLVTLFGSHRRCGRRCSVTWPGFEMTSVAPMSAYARAARRLELGPGGRALLRRARGGRRAPRRPGVEPTWSAATPRPTASRPPRSSSAPPPCRCWRTASPAISSTRGPVAGRRCGPPRRQRAGRRARPALA